MTGHDEQTEAIVLRMIDYGESDRIVTMLTPSHGKVSAFARAARKSKRRFGGGLDLFSHLNAFLKPPGTSQSALWRLSSIDLLDPHIGLRSDLTRLSTATYLSECLWMLASEGDPQPKLFAWWRGVLSKLADPAFVFAADSRYDLELLALCGYSPRWDRCTVCGHPPRGERLFFSFDRGGVSCDTCRRSGEGAWLAAPVVACLVRGEAIPVVGRAPLQRTLDAFFTYTVGREPKSQRFRNEVVCGTG